jgi:hypothetical protein
MAFLPFEFISFFGDLDDVDHDFSSGLKRMSPLEQQPSFVIHTISPAGAWR